MLTLSLVANTVLVLRLKKAGLVQKQQANSLMFHQLLLQSGTQICGLMRSRLVTVITENIGQVLSLVKLRLGVLVPVIDNEPPFDELQDMITLVLGDLREMSKAIDPKQVGDMPLHSSLAHEMRHWQKRGSTCELMHDDREDMLRPSQRIIVFSQFQEIMETLVVQQDQRLISVTQHISNHELMLVVSGIGQRTNEASLQRRINAWRNQFEVIGGGWIRFGSLAKSLSV